MRWWLLRRLGMLLYEYNIYEGNYVFNKNLALNIIIKQHFCWNLIVVILIFMELCTYPPIFRQTQVLECNELCPLTVCPFVCPFIFLHIICSCYLSDNATIYKTNFSLRFLMIVFILLFLNIKFLSSFYPIND